MNINDEQTLVGAYTNKFGERHALKTYDDVFGSLWVYSEVHGPLGVIRARTWDDAYEIAQDEIMTSVDEEDLVEAYGMYIMKNGGRYYVCSDFYTDDAHFEDFDRRVPGRRVLADFVTKAKAQAFALAYAGKNELELVEGYEYQPNFRGTGIVTYDTEWEILPLTQDSAQSLGITIQVTED